MNEPAVLESPPSSAHKASVFAEVAAQDITALNPNPVGELWLWFKAVRFYHQAELDQSTRGGPTEQDRQDQKRMLAQLISAGECLIHSLRRHDVTAKLDVKLADVEATIEGLYISQRVLLGGMTETRRAEVLKEVFDAA